MQTTRWILSDSVSSYRCLNGRLSRKNGQDDTDRTPRMSRNEKQTCNELISPALTAAGWAWDREVIIGPGRVNLTGESMYDDSQQIVADYLLRYHNLPLAILEAKAEGIDAADGIQQGSRYAGRLDIRYSISSNGREYILTDNETSENETLSSPPTPEHLLERLVIEIDWPKWESTFKAPWHIDQVSRKKVRGFQEAAIYRTLSTFAQGRDRALLLMATGTGKTFTVFQLCWKLLEGGILDRHHVLFLTDRNSLKNQAYNAFSAFSATERVIVDKDTVSRGAHQVGKVFFANYQNLDEELNGKKLYEHFDADFFDLVIVDECHRSGFGDWFGVLEHFASARHLGLTATPRELQQETRVLSTEEKRRDTYVYFGPPIFTYSLKDAIEDGFLVPYLLEERISNVDEDGYTGPDGKRYATSNFERDIRMPERTKFIAEDLWKLLGKYDLQQEKTIVFCVDDTHAAFMAAELRRLSGDPNFAARITRSERNSHQLERNFAQVGASKPRIAVTVDLLSTGFDAPDVRNIVFARPLKSSILYKQMKGRGTRLCDDIDKRYFTIFDYAGASSLEDSEFDGHPANVQKSKSPKKKSPKKSAATSPPKPVAAGVSVYLSESERYVCLADGRKVPFEEYREQSKEVIREIAPGDIRQLLDLWVVKESRKDLREELREHNIYVPAFRHFYQLDETDDVDILAKVGFDLPRVPSRRDRSNRFWDAEEPWLRSLVGISENVVTPFPKLGTPSAVPLAAEVPAAGYHVDDYRIKFWHAALDHYTLFGIDDLEQGETYRTPQFTEQFGSFASFLKGYGGATRLRENLEDVKRHLYVKMSA